MSKQRFCNISYNKLFETLVKELHVKRGDYLIITSIKELEFYDFDLEDFFYMLHYIVGKKGKVLFHPETDISVPEYKFEICKEFLSTTGNTVVCSDNLHHKNISLSEAKHLYEIVFEKSKTSRFCKKISYSEIAKQDLANKNVKALNVGRDLRNLLNIIKGFTTIYKQYLEKGDFISINSVSQFEFIAPSDCKKGSIFNYIFKKRIKILSNNKLLNLCIDLK